jgi:hypothetical protein
MWHKKGRVGNGSETGTQVYSQMEVVKFEKHPFTLNVGGNLISNNVYGIIKIQEGAVPTLIGTTKERYELKQPDEYISKFDEMVGKPVETLGFLGAKAEKLFITWELPQIDIKGDKVEMYGLLSFGFDGIYGNHLFATSVRVVCKNTHNMAVRDSENSANHGRGKNKNNAIVTTKHNQKDHLDVLGYWMRYVDEESQRQVDITKNLFVKMAEKPLTLDDAYGFFAKVHPYPNEVSSFIPPELINGENEKNKTAKEDADESRELLMSLFEGKGIEISRDVWGAYNCVTEMQNHHIKSKKNDGTDSILIGSRGKVMDKALGVAMEYVYADKG